MNLTTTIPLRDLKKNYLVFFFLLFPFLLAAQILDVNKSAFSDDDPFFDVEFIRLNEIKSISASRSSKKVQDIIRKKSVDYYYEFNPNGTLHQQTLIQTGKTIDKDSTITIHHYDKNNHLITKRRNDNYGFYSFNYLIDSLGNIVKQTYCRDENASTLRGMFTLGKQYIIASDSFFHEKLSDKQIKKKYYNNYGKIYKEQTDYHDDYGYLIETSSKFIIGNNKTRITYQYDEKGRLARIDNYSNIGATKKITETYSYDDVGNVLEINVYKNDVHTTIKQYLYYSETMLLTALLIQDVESKLIQITQYKYELYSDEVSNSELDKPLNMIKNLKKDTLTPP